MIPKRLLIIEDDQEMCEEMCDTLGDDGFTLEVAQNGTDGLSLVRKHRFDIVLLDLKIPHVNGLDILDFIKKEYPQTFVIILSGSSVIKEIDEEECCVKKYFDTRIELADEVFSKPCDMRKLLAIIEERTQPQ